MIDAKTQQKYAAYIQPMLKTKGWETLRILLEDRRTNAINLLIEEVDPHRIASLQGIVRGINDLFAQVKLYGDIKIKGRQDDDEEDSVQ